MILSLLWREGFHGRQSNNEILYSKRDERWQRVEKFQRGLQRNKNLSSMLYGCSNEQIDKGSME